jgi:hypothetical protein
LAVTSAAAFCQILLDSFGGTDFDTTAAATVEVEGVVVKSFNQAS